MSTTRRPQTVASDDRALQNEANNRAHAEAGAARAAAMAAWKDAGSPQNEWPKVRDRLTEIGKAAQAKMAHNNDPKNINELRQKSAEGRAARSAIHSESLAVPIDGDEGSDR